jgi:hypothetical protein
VNVEIEETTLGEAIVLIISDVLLCGRFDLYFCRTGRARLALQSIISRWRILKSTSWSMR